MKIEDLKVGKRAKIKGFAPGQKMYRHKLLTMGMLPNTEFTLKRKAPLGDPVEVSVRGFSLSLRKAEANTLIIEQI